MRAVVLLLLLFLAPLLPLPAMAGPLEGKTYIVELSSSQAASGYGAYLLPPLLAELAASGMKPWKTLGPGVDMVVNVVPESDVGRWVTRGGERLWLHTVSVTVGLSPETRVIPPDGTPDFGVRAVLVTPDPDREDELACLIRLATRTALARYRQGGGVLRTDGSTCLRR